MTPRVTASSCAVSGLGADGGLEALGGDAGVGADDWTTTISLIVARFVQGEPLENLGSFKLEDALE